jgi:hypothetical protein
MTPLCKLARIHGLYRQKRDTTAGVKDVLLL